MARSLTIKHEETASTSPLFTGFLLLSVLWLIAGTLASGDAQAQAEQTTNAEQTTDAGQTIDPGPSVAVPVLP